MAISNLYNYPQKYFLEGEALRHFGIKASTYRSWHASGLKIPGRYKVKKTNYYVIEPEEFHKWLIETRLEPATKLNKLHDGRVSQRKKNHIKGGKPTSDVVPGEKGVQSSPSRSPGANKDQLEWDINGLAI